MIATDKQKGRESYPYLLASHIRALRLASLPTGYEQWAVHRELYYLMIATGRRYNDLFDLDASELRLHPGYGPYIQIGGPQRSWPIVIPLWVFPGAAAIVEKYRDNSRDAFWLLDRNCQIGQEAFIQIVHQITASLPNFPYRLTYAHAINTFVSMYYSHQQCYHLLSAMTGITAKWIQPPSVRMKPDQVLAAAEGLYFQELEIL